MSISIQDLPTEILVIIFDKLNMINIESCSETCVRWKYICIRYFFQAYLQEIAKYDDETKISLMDDGWTNLCYNNYNLIESLYNKIAKGLASSKSGHSYLS